MCYAEREEYGKIAVEVISNDGGEKRISRIVIVPTFREKDLERFKEVMQRNPKMLPENGIS